MGSAWVGRAGGPLAGAQLVALVDANGSASHPYCGSEPLVSGRESNRNLADAVHFLCVLHGRHPGAIDHAANRTPEAEARAWLDGAIPAFAAERNLLTRLAVAVGPLPSTPGAADSDAVLLGQRHAVEMLACSERKGCAFGAALALALDWTAVRAVMDVAAVRFGVEGGFYRLGDRDMARALADGFAATPALQRALLFGAEQISVQHRGLWDLLEARQQARAGD